MNLTLDSVVRDLPPSVVALYGARSDLATRFLWKAFYNLHCRGLLSEATCLVGIDIRNHTRSSFERWLRKRLRVGDDSRWAGFASKLYYLKADVTSAEDMEVVARFLKNQVRTLEANLVSYLALQPSLYEPTIANIGGCCLVCRAGKSAFVHRIVIEKPFGADLQSSVSLNTAVKLVFPEEWVYRTDHYQGKGMCQFVFSVRRHNALVEALLNPAHIDFVGISALEQLDVGDRGEYYDRNGVFRDMFQNHLLELASLIGMRMPREITADSLESAQLRFLDCLKKITPQMAKRVSAAGRYTAGKIGSVKVPAYNQTPGVARNSRTATFGAMKLVPFMGSWRDIPFYLRSGKALQEKLTRITVVYRIPDWIREGSRELALGLSPNRLVISIDPVPRIELIINGKLDGPGQELGEGQFSLNYHDQFGSPEPFTPYAYLLWHILAGDRIPFKTGRIVEKSWEIIDPIVRHYEKHPDQVLDYEPGTWGPEIRTKIPGKGRIWTPHN